MAHCITHRLAALAALALVSCSPASADPGAHHTSVVLVVAPAAAATPTDPVRTPARAGSRLVLWDSAKPQQPPQALIDGEYAAVALCDTSTDGTRLLISLQRKPGDDWHVCELPVAGGVPVPVSPAGASTVAAAYLPEDRVVFAADLAGTRDPRDDGPALHLYTCDRSGAELRRISFNPSTDTDPSVLPDGRVLFAGWQPPGRGRPEGAFGLFTVRHDGTGLSAHADDHELHGDRLRPRQIGGRLLCLTSLDGATPTLCCPPGGKPVLTRGTLPAPPPGQWTAADGDAPRSNTPGSNTTGSNTAGALWLCGSPGKTGSDETRGLYRSSEKGLEALLVDPSLDVLDVRRVVRRPPPRGHVSSVDPTRTTGELLCLDARRADGLHSPASEAAADLAAAARSLRILSAVPMPLDGSGPPAQTVAASDRLTPTGLTPTGLIPTGPATATLATVDLQTDGSAWLTVPADTPLRFQTLDTQGQVLLDSTTWIWVRPGERRSCIGCHEDRQSAPSNRAPAALRGEPIDVGQRATEATH